MQPAALCVGLGLEWFSPSPRCFIKLGNQSLSGPSLVVRALFTLVIAGLLQIAMQVMVPVWSLAP